jgi:hypothetical protein
VGNAVDINSCGNVSCPRVPTSVANAVAIQFVSQAGPMGENLSQHKELLHECPSDIEAKSKKNVPFPENDVMIFFDF